MLSFSPKQVSKELLNELPERARKVISDRYGLGGSGEQRTLESIGEDYGITRERVRQIENHSLETLRGSDTYTTHKKSLEDLKNVLNELGTVVAEETLLTVVPKNDTERNHVVFLLTVGHQFDDRREDAHFNRRWHADRDISDRVERALVNLYEKTSPDELMTETDFIERFSKELKSEGVKGKPEEVLKRWLEISKRLGKNPLGEWGRVESPHVRIKNTRDFAYLTLKRHGNPMHFTEVAKGINSLFNREAHPATTHNELIKDKRFVLVGRGLYALQEWGYNPGIVRDVIRGIISREGSLTRDEIIERVKRERYVKDATIVVNLQNNVFVRTPDGKYGLK